MVSEKFENVIETKNDSLGEGIASVIKGVLRRRKWTVQYLAAQTGVARQTLSLLLASAKGRSWTLNHLVRVATVIDVSLTDLIAAAESGEELSSLMIDLAGTEPSSKERLTRIIQTLAAKGTSPEVLDLYFTADMMALSVPDYVKEYLNGDLDDRSVYETLTRVNENLGPEENLWGKLAALMAKPKSE